MGEHGGHAVTHTCSLERRDRRPFAFARCQELLTCLTWCLWFCRAAAPSVVVPVGFDTNDRATWSRWAAPHTDPLPDHHGQWFDKAYRAEQLATLLPLFWQRYSDPLWQRSLQLAIRNYADAAVMGTLQGNVILAQVGLESLAYAHLVRSSQQLQPKQFTHPVSQHLRRFLRDVGIPTTIPRTFYGLRRVMANHRGTALLLLRGCATTSSMRTVTGLTGVAGRSGTRAGGWQCGTGARCARGCRV